METAVVVQKAFDWNVWILKKVELFPKSYRFSIGQRLADSSLELLMRLTDAGFRVDRKQSLEIAQREVNRLRLLLRLAKELKILPMQSWTFATGEVDEMGRMTGGWMRSVSGRTVEA